LELVDRDRSHGARETERRVVPGEPEDERALRKTPVVVSAPAALAIRIEKAQSAQSG
jgi:hypothetical protein